jgi:exo-beta-N-acetylmuramidase NamZ-like protein
MCFAGNKIFVALGTIAANARGDRAASGNLTAINVYALAEVNRQLRTNLIARSKRGKREMFFKCCGGSSIASQFARGIGPAGIVASWTPDGVRFRSERSPYLLY